MKYTKEDLYIGMKFYRTDTSPIWMITDIKGEEISFTIFPGRNMIHTYFTGNFLKYVKEIIPKHYIYEIY